MTLLEKIRKNSLEARKLRDSIKSNLLVTLLSEAQAVGKNAKPPRESTDEEVVQVIKKFIKNAEETSGLAANHLDAVHQSSRELEILASYLPEQLSEETIAEIVKDLKATNLDMRAIMQYFKETHTGRYDGGIVAKYAKS